MGRKAKSFVWDHFKKQENHQGKTAYFCKYCGAKYCFKNVTRKCEHLSKCLKCPIEVRQSLWKKADKDNCGQLSVDVDESHNPTVVQSSSQIKNPCISLTGSPAASSPSGLKKQEIILNNVLDHMSPTQQETASEKLCRFIYVSGVPLTIVEDELFIDLCNYIRPAFQLPKKKTVSTTYLEGEFNHVYTDVNTLVTEASNLHLRCDGWSNLRNESIVNFLLCTPKPIFIKCVDTKTNRHNAGYLCSEIKDVMEEYGGDRFFVLIGDNASNMQTAFQEVQQEYPNVTILSCLAHTLHLMCGDILKCSSVDEFFQEVLNIINTIRQSQILSATLTEIQDKNKCKVSLKLPGKTQGSYLFSLESLLQNKKNLQQLAIQSYEVACVFKHKSNKQLKLKLLDENFWDRVEKMIPLFKTVVTWITILEGDEPLIHRVKEAIEEIDKNLNLALCNSFLADDEKSTLIRTLQERKDSVVRPIHLAAALLDPSSRGSNLSSSELWNAKEFIDSTATCMDNVDSEVVSEELNLYTSKSGEIWGRDFVWKYVNKAVPLNWWKGMCERTQLSKVAERILSAPVTSVEQTFSTFNRLRSNISNGLTAERAGKLTYISHNWKQLHYYKASKIVKSGKLLLVEDPEDDEGDQEGGEEDGEMTVSEDLEYYPYEWLKSEFEDVKVEEKSLVFNF